MSLSTFQTLSNESSHFQPNGDGIQDVVTASYAGDTVAVNFGQASPGVGALLPFALTTRAEARFAMASLDRKLESLGLQKGAVGAFQARVEVAIDNLQSIVTNYATAESQIRDVDVAQEAAELIRLQILQQAATAVLAQANQAPALVLSLLE